MSDVLLVGAVFAIIIAIVTAVSIPWAKLLDKNRRDTYTRSDIEHLANTPCKKCGKPLRKCGCEDL